MNLNIEALVGKIGFHETRNRSHAVPSRKKLWRCCGRPSFYRSSIVAKETHFRAEASRISLPRTGHVDKPREKRTDNTTGHRREVRNDVRPERVACAHRLLTNFTRRASSTISCLRLCCTGVHAPLDPLSLSPSPRFISIVSFSAPLSLSIPYNFLLVLLYVACIPWKIFDLSSRYFFVSLPLVHSSREIFDLSFVFFPFHLRSTKWARSCIVSKHKLSRVFHAHTPTMIERCIGRVPKPFNIILCYFRTRLLFRVKFIRFNSFFFYIYILR